MQTPLLLPNNEGDVPQGTIQSSLYFQPTIRHEGFKDLVGPQVGIDGIALSAKERDAKLSELAEIVLLTTFLYRNSNETGFVVLSTVLLTWAIISPQ